MPWHQQHRVIAVDKSETETRYHYKKGYVRVNYGEGIDSKCVCPKSIRKKGTKSYRRAHLTLCPWNSQSWVKRRFGRIKGKRTKLSNQR